MKYLKQAEQIISASSYHSWKRPVCDRNGEIAVSESELKRNIALALSNKDTHWDGLIATVLEESKQLLNTEKGWVSALEEMTKALKQEQALSASMANALEFYAIRDRCFDPKISPAKQALAEYKAALKAIK